MADIESYLRETALPTIWCAGCGHGIVTRAALAAIDKMGWNRDEIIAVSGIGCSSRVPLYCDFNAIQTTHGRAVAFATGMKMAKPNMHVVLFLGDGDCAAIGGNHLIHAAKRNMNMTVIVMNNRIYGMTGGQVSPTTDYEAVTATSPYGNIEPELDVCGVAAAAGATFVARTTAYHVPQMEKLIEQGLRNDGFSLIEILDPCPTSYGRRNKFKTPSSMYEYLRDNAVPVAKAADMTEEELKGKIVCGVLTDKKQNGFMQEYDRLIGRAEQKKKEFRSLTDGTEAVPEKFETTRFKLTGSGGQGLIMAGIILAEAALRTGLEACQSQSYGPEARGGASRSEVILSRKKINYPEVIRADVLLAMTQQSFDKFLPDVKEGGIVIADTSFVTEMPEEISAKVYKCPITKRCVEKFNTKLCANVAVIGMLAYILKDIPMEVFEEAVAARIPASAKELNLNALHAGYEWAAELDQQEA